MTAQHNDTVSIHYTGKFDDGTVFDSSIGHDPLEFTVGAGQVIPGFEEGVVGMKANDRKNISIAPDMAYGEYHDSLLVEVPKNSIPDEIELQVGMPLQMENNEGKSFIVVIKEITNDSVKLDANHPMAGKNLNFELELVKIERQ